MDDVALQYCVSRAHSHFPSLGIAPCRNNSTSTLAACSVEVANECSKSVHNR